MPCAWNPCVMKFSFPKDVYTEQLGRVKFDVMDLEIKIPGMKVRQK